MLDIFYLFWDMFETKLNVIIKFHCKKELKNITFEEVMAKTGFSDAVTLI